MKTTTALSASLIISHLFASACLAQQRQVYAEVVRVEPVYHHVQLNKRACVSATTNKGSRIVAGAIIGGIVGTLTGYDKYTRRSGSIYGALIGADIGYQQQQNSQGVGGAACHLQSLSADNNGKIRGYHVTYQHAGRRFNTFVRQHPGDSIRLNPQLTTAH